MDMARDDTSSSRREESGGLRYAAPTGGANRFKPPVKPAPWTGVMETLVAVGGASAPQQQAAPTALSAGFQAYISKPFEPENLLRVITQLLLKHHKTA